MSDDQRREEEGWQEMQKFFRNPGTAYVTDKEEQTLKYMARVGVSLDEATLTGLETWHMFSQNFCPAIELEFGHLWVRLTASFRGTSSSGWAWHQVKEEVKELSADQARLAFALGNAMASLTLDGVVARIDPEDVSPLNTRDRCKRQVCSCQHRQARASCGRLTWKTSDGLMKG